MRQYELGLSKECKNKFLLFSFQVSAHMQYNRASVPVVKNTPAPLQISPPPVKMSPLKIEASPVKIPVKNAVKTSACEENVTGCPVI